MLQLDLGETAEQLSATARALVANEIAPLAADIDRANAFPRQLWLDAGLAPLAQGYESGKEAQAFFSQDIFVIRAAVRRRNGLKDAMVRKIAEPRREDVLGKAEVLLELAEPAQPIECVANDEQRPPIADRRWCSSYRENEQAGRLPR